MTTESRDLDLNALLAKMIRLLILYRMTKLPKTPPRISRRTKSARPGGYGSFVARRAPGTEPAVFQDEVKAPEKVAEEVKVDRSGSQDQNWFGLERAHLLDAAKDQTKDFENPVSGGANTVSMRALPKHITTGSEVFGLQPGTKGAVPFSRVLRDAGKAARPLVDKVLGDFQAQTGIKVPPAMVNAALAKPERLLNILQVTPAQLSAGTDAMNLAHKAGHLPDMKAAPRILADLFDFSKIDQQAYSRPENALAEAAPLLYRGHVPSDLSDAQAKMNTITAEVFDKLSGNRELDRSDRFEVKYGDSTFTRLDTFLDALREDGHDVKVSVEHRIANFADLSTKLPNGDMVDVPAPLMVKTGIIDDEGREAVVPAVHSDLIINISSSDDSQHGKIDAKVKWYQGIPSTGFFPADIARSPDWLGGQEVNVFEGDDAQKAIELAGMFSDVVNRVSDEAGFLASGYGMTGVCNDSVAVIQQAITGKATGYPLIMRDETIKPHLEGLLNDKSTRDDPLVRDLLSAIDALPSDVEDNDSWRERAVASLPYAAGEEVLMSTGHARETLLNEKF